jgi:hypothetical protein
LVLSGRQEEAQDTEVEPAAMNNRERIARGLVVIGSLILFASAALHGFAGYPVLSRGLATANLKPFLGGGVKAFWLLGSWHWTALGVIALAVAFRGTALRRFLILMCGLVVLVDAVGTVVAVGFFPGNELLSLGGLAILSGAALLEGSHSPQA